jgi:hypothetical protein
MSPKITQVAKNTILSRIYGKQRGWVFTQNDFLDLESPSNIRKSLSQLEETGVVRRIGHGIYDYPRKHKILGMLPPELSKVAEALARKYQIRIQPTGAYAANLLGLSEQIPGKLTFLTDGFSKTVKVNGGEILFRKTTPKNMKVAGTISGTVIQALKHMGSANITPQSIYKIKRKLGEVEKKRLKLDAPIAPAWIARIILKDLLDG